MTRERSECDLLGISCALMLVRRGHASCIDARGVCSIMQPHRSSRGGGVIFAFTCRLKLVRNIKSSLSWILCIVGHGINIPKIISMAAMDFFGSF
jgi:hypothetical protein